MIECHQLCLCCEKFYDQTVFQNSHFFQSVTIDLFYLKFWSVTKYCGLPACHTPPQKAGVCASVRIATFLPSVYTDILSFIQKCRTFGFGKTHCQTFRHSERLAMPSSDSPMGTFAKMFSHQEVFTQLSTLSNLKDCCKIGLFSCSLFTSEFVFPSCHR